MYIYGGKFQLCDLINHPFLQSYQSWKNIAEIYPSLSNENNTVVITAETINLSDIVTYEDHCAFFVNISRFCDVFVSLEKLFILSENDEKIRFDPKTIELTIQDSHEKLKNMDLLNLNIPFYSIPYTSYALKVSFDFDLIDMLKNNKLYCFMLSKRKFLTDEIRARKLQYWNNHDISEGLVKIP